MFTDENVPMECHECEALCEGLTDTICHLLQAHGEDYNQDEAAKFAQIWVAQAHIEQEEAAAEYRKQRKLDQAIEADTFPNK